MSFREDGERIMAELFSPETLERRNQQRNSFNADIQDFATEVCFGRVWARPALERKQRSMVTVALLIALNLQTQLRQHIEVALDNGCTAEEIREIILHSAVYCGLPAASSAMKTAEEVLRIRGELD